MQRPSWLSIALMAGLWLAGFLAAMPLVKAPVYWDESVHYYTARHGDPVDEHITDLWGNPVSSPEALFWQRPAWYAAFRLPAQGDLETFRVAHAAVAAFLAPIGFAVLRSFGFRRTTGTLAGLALALMPPLPTWAAFGFMDPMMAECLGLAVVFRRVRMWVASAAFGVLAVWMKETAFVLVALYAVVEAVRGLRARTVSLWPVRADARTTSAVYAALLAPLPLIYGMMKDVPIPGGVAYHPDGQILDAVWGTSWLAVPLLVGLAFPRSRPLAALGLGCGLFFVALQLLGRSTESWYLIPSLLFGVVGAAAACEAALGAAHRPAVIAATIALAVATAAVAAATVALPEEHGREHLFPFSGTGPRSLRETYTYETTERDQDLVAAFGAIPLEEHPTVLMVEPHWPPPYVTMADAGHVIMDMAYVRAVIPFDVDPLAAQIEDNATWTLLYDGPHPMQHAVKEVYADCIVGDFGGLHLIRGGPCAGRAQALAEANHRFGGP